MKNRIAAIVGAVLVTCAVGVAPTAAAKPTAVNGNKVAVIAKKVGTITQFAWAKNGDMFVSSAGAKNAKGGIYVIKRGTKRAKRISGSPQLAFGIAYSKRKFYASVGSKIIALGGWNGKGFKHRRTVLKANKKNFTSFNGLAIAPSGRIYTGVTFEFDSAASTKKYASSVVSVRKSGGGVKVIAKGIRQPWQLTFLTGEKQPIGTALAQDSPAGTDAADFIYKANPGSDFGFPTCGWGPSTAAICAPFTKPLVIFPNPAPLPSVSATGITHRGKKLFVAQFNPVAPKVISMNGKGGGVKDVLTKFPAPAVGVGIYKDHLYSSDEGGSIYKVKL